MQFSVFYFVIFYEGRYVIMVHILTSHEGRSLLGFFSCVCVTGYFALVNGRPPGSAALQRRLSSFQAQIAVLLRWPHSLKKLPCHFEAFPFKYTWERWLSGSALLGTDSDAQHSFGFIY